MPIMQKSWVEFLVEKEREEERNRKHTKITLRNPQPSLNGKNRILLYTKKRITSVDELLDGVLWGSLAAVYRPFSEFWASENCVRKNTES